MAGWDCICPAAIGPIPTTADAFQPNFNCCPGKSTDAFIEKLDPSGSSLAYGSFLGGHGFDFGFAIAVDQRGAAYVVGATDSRDFPTTAGAFDTTPGDHRPFVTKFDINEPPDCSHVTATPNMLWPPNHKLVPVSLAGATDPDGDQVTFTITGVTQDEPTGRKPDALLGAGSNEVSLRATRSGAGRVYRIAYKATDGRGGECSGTATVGVPHNKHGTAVDSAPPSYNSLGG